MQENTFNLLEVPELKELQGALEKKYPGLSFVVIQLTSVSLMVSDVRGYAQAHLQNEARNDISAQMLACQSALVKVVAGMGIARDDFLHAGEVITRAIILHAMPAANQRLN